MNQVGTEKIVVNFSGEDVRGREDFESDTGYRVPKFCNLRLLSEWENIEDLPPVCKMALQWVPAESTACLSGPLSEAHIYIDGSFKNQVLGWGLAVVGFRDYCVDKEGGGFSFLGYKGSFINIWGDQSLPLRDGDAKDAEHVGMAIALKIILSGQISAPVVIIHCDCMKAIYTAKGFSWDTGSD